MEDSVGASLQRALDAAGVSQADLARRIGVSTKHVNGVIQGKNRLSVIVALRIEMAVPSISAEGLLIDQVRHEIRSAANAESSGSQ